LKINLKGDTGSILEGIHLLAKDLDIELSTDGFPILVTQKKGDIEVSCKENQGEISFEKEIHFFRAFGLLLENYKEQTEFNITETPQFEMTGAMLDASRNAVLSINGIKNLLRTMATMGLDTLMMYTEDTYEVKEYPYFGYMRGRYTQNELKECDEYAQKLGIEMIPCIQTLAHLKEALKWDEHSKIRDTADILLVDEPETYQFLDKIITAATEPFSTDKIHIGMDEAHQLGLGKYLEENGYEDRFEIMNKHLQKVISITESKNLKSMMWSDMFFRLGSKTGDYYDNESEIPEEIIRSMPDVEMIYWDYYHSDKETYQTMIQNHRALDQNLIFAGGAWTWNGISPNYGKAKETTEAALMACKEENVNEIFVTLWGDNGAETPSLTALPVLQLYAEHAYNKNVSQQKLEKRFSYCTGYDLKDFLLFKNFDETPGVKENNPYESNPSKFLLWQDVLMGLYDKNIEDIELNKHYADLYDELKKIEYSSTTITLLFDFYKQLALVLSTKSEMGIKLKSAYDKNDKNKMKYYLKEIKSLYNNVDSLRKKHRELWHTINKPFGWEILDIRYGGVLSRLDSASYRLKLWIEKDHPIEELEQKRLPYEGFNNRKDGTLGQNMYHRIISASVLSG